MKNFELGTFSVDVQLLPDGLYDVYIAHEGSSGCHYSGVTADRIGNILAGNIEAVSSEYAGNWDSVDDEPEQFPIREKDGSVVLWQNEGSLAEDRLFFIRCTLEEVFADEPWQVTDSVGCWDGTKHSSELILPGNICNPRIFLGLASGKLFVDPAGDLVFTGCHHDGFNSYTYTRVSKEKSRRHIGNEVLHALYPAL